LHSRQNARALSCSTFSECAHTHDVGEFFNQYTFLFLGTLHSSGTTTKVFYVLKYEH
jgi:hypothetical protein